MTEPSYELVEGIERLYTDLQSQFITEQGLLEVADAVAWL